MQRRGKRDREAMGLSTRSTVIPEKRLAMIGLRRRAAELYPAISVVRPVTREECRGGHRPCPFVGCANNLYLDINPETGAIKLNFPDLEPWEMPAARSCSDDISERGGLTLEEVGEVMNITRERVRQIEITALLKLKVGAND